MKILICNYEYPPLGGGGGVITQALARDLAKRHSVTLVTSGISTLPALDEDGNLTVMRLPVIGRRGLSTASLASMSAFVLQAITRSKSLSRAIEADIVNTHFVLPTGPAGHALAERLDVPNVLSVHGGDLYDPSKSISPHRHWILRKAVRSYCRRAAHVVAQSENTMENLSNYFGYDGPRSIIPLGIERPTSPAGGQDETPSASSTPCLVTVGRLVARKGLEGLIRIADRMRDIEFQLVIIGDGPEKERLSNQIDHLKLGGKVKLLGRVEEAEKQQILSDASLYVSTSQHEGFGLVFLEAWAAGLPVVCYNHGGQVDFMRDGRNGFLVPLNDESTFESRLRRLISEPALRQQMARAAADDVEDYFIESCARRYESLFCEILSRGPQSEPVPQRR